MCFTVFATGACAYAAQVPCLLRQEQIKTTTADINRVVTTRFFMRLWLNELGKNKSIIDTDKQLFIFYAKK